MNPKTIWRLDKLVGTPACALLSWPAHLDRIFSARRNSPPKRIVFVKLIEMGSTVLACPAFEEATRMVGRENLFFLAFRQNRAIVDLLPYFPPQNVITIRDTSLTTFVADLFQAIRRIRREGIDAAVDMEGLTRSSAIITYLTGARLRAGYFNFTSEGPYRGRLFNRELHYNFHHHISHAFVALVKALRAPADQVPLLKEPVDARLAKLPQHKPTEADRRTVLGMISERTHEKPGPIVLLNANCSDLLPLRRWPTANFIQLGKQLLEAMPDLTVIVTGAPDEREQAEVIARDIGPQNRVFSLAGHTTLSQLLALYALGTVLISNDSGPCHFAALTPIHVIALFGPETPLLYAPLGDNATCLSANLACSPCVNMLNHRFSPCNDNQCMKRIPVDRVYREALNVLDRSSKK